MCNGSSQGTNGLQNPWARQSGFGMSPMRTSGFPSQAPGFSMGGPDVAAPNPTRPRFPPELENPPYPGEQPTRPTMQPMGMQTGGLTPSDQMASQPPPMRTSSLPTQPAYGQYSSMLRQAAPPPPVDNRPPPPGTLPPPGVPPPYTPPGTPPSQPPGGIPQQPPTPPGFFSSEGTTPWFAPTTAGHLGMSTGQPTMPGMQWNNETKQWGFRPGTEPVAPDGRKPTGWGNNGWQY